MKSIECYVVIGSFTVLLVGMLIVWDRLRNKNQGFGPNSIKALGLVIFIPTLVIVSVVMELKPETVTALLGTVAGYVLCNSKKEDE